MLNKNYTQQHVCHTTRIADEKSEKIQIIMALLLTSASAIPLLLLCRYAVPMNDDLNFALNGNIYEVTAMIYNNIQGTYAAKFCEIFNFFNFFGVRAYPATCAATILIHLGAWLFAIRSVLVNVFSCNKWNCTLWIYSTVVLYIANFLDNGETFFWQNGATVYTYPLSMILFAVGFYTMTFRATKRKKAAYIVMAALCLFWACGGTLLIAAIACSVFLYCSVQSLFNKSQNRSVAFVLLGLCLAFALFNAFAPGYHVRKSRTYNLRIEEPPDLSAALVDSLTIATQHWIKYAVLFAIVSVLLVLPCREIVKASDKKIFRFPLASFIFVLAAVVVCLFPLAFGSGLDYIFRRYSSTLDSAFAGAVLFLAILFWGWFFRVFMTRINTTKTRLFTYVCIAVLLIMRLDYNKMHTTVIVEDMHNGTLKTYKELHHAAFEYAANTEEPDIIITLPPVYPLFPFFQPTPHDSEAYSNRMFAGYFGLNSVTVQQYVPLDSDVYN